MRNLTIKFTSLKDVKNLISFFFRTKDETIFNFVEENEKTYIYKVNKTIWVSKYYQYSNYSKIMRIEKFEDYFIICYDEI